ncbi:transposase, partial [Pseudomonas khavaziana]|uniref:transposase n=1 Tax=Pseudomonas khavaziana TaxID=2842351 RepID=UPI00384EAC26
CLREPLVLHSDNGAPMKSVTLLSKMYELGITPSRGRPRVSNDYPYSESLFRTLKYRPQWPLEGFASLDAARTWVRDFMRWYNSEHRHSRIRFVTPSERHGGQHHQILEACCYVMHAGCSWRMLPREFLHWDNVYKTFRRWSAQGKFEQMHDRFRAQWRERVDRDEKPSAAVLDSQSTRSSPQGGESGYDAGKKVKGRKRSLIVDTLGLLLAVSISAASMQDRDAADDAATSSMGKYPSLNTLFVDSA